jgi:regulator of sirC expression with transglutaminase-like and TPR domain
MSRPGAPGPPFDSNDDESGIGLLDVELERDAFFDHLAGFDLLAAVAMLKRVGGSRADVAGVEHAVDGWAEQVRDRIRHAGNIVALHDVLFATAGFRGDEHDYDAPENSFLADVVRRRRGLPIALSVVLKAVAERAGILAWGLSLPHHFLVAVFVDEERFAVVDAFEGGRLLAPEEISKRTGVPPSELPELLQPASSSTILRRMLTNLRASYLRRKQHEPLCRVLSRLLLFSPRDPQLLLARAEVLRLCLDDESAAKDATAARALAGDDHDVARAAEHLLTLLEERVVH